MSATNTNASVTRLATLAAVTILMQQVAGKAVRDALFLSHFDVSGLPAIIIASSFLSIAAGLLFSRSMAKVSPYRLLPGAFGTSGVLLLIT